MKNINPYWGDAYFEDGYMWYFDNAIFALCRMNLKTGKVDILAAYIGKRTFLRNRIFAYKDVFFITAYNSSNVLKYTKIENKIDELKNEHERFLSESNYNFYDFHMCVEDKIWYFSKYHTKPVYYFDMHKEQFYQDDIRNKYISRYINKGEIATFYSNGYEDCYWSAIYNTNIFIKYNLKDRSIEEFKISDTNIHLNAICFDGEKVWLTQSDNGDIICAKLSGEIVNIFNGISNGVGNEFSKIINTRDNIVALPRLGDILLLIDKKDMKMCKINLKESGLESVASRAGYAKIINCFELEGQLLFPPWGLNSLFSISRLGGELQKIDISYLESELWDIALNREKCLYESQDINLECLIKYNLLSENKAYMDECIIGKKIFDCISEMSK